jgi:putative hemolysin
MKKILFLTLLLALIISGCAINKNQANTDDKNSQNGKQLVGGDKDEHGCIGSAGYSWCELKQKCLRTWEEKCEASTTDATADWEIYKNDKLGYELKLPKTWVGYKITEGDNPTFSYSGFSFGSPHQPFTIFYINRYDKKQWDAVVKKDAVKVLDQSDDTVLVCDGCCFENGDFTGGGQFDEFQKQRCRDVPQIIKTFKKASVAGLANPASSFCEEQGGQSNIVTDQDGSQRGECVIPGGKTCDEWEFFRGTCK